MRISLSLEEVKGIIAKNFEADIESVGIILNKKLWIKDKNNEEFEVLDSHLIFELDKPMIKQEQVKANKWSKT